MVLAIKMEHDINKACFPLLPSLDTTTYWYQIYRQVLPGKVATPPHQQARVSSVLDGIKGPVTESYCMQLARKVGSQVMSDRTLRGGGDKAVPKFRVTSHTNPLQETVC